MFQVFVKNSVEAGKFYQRAFDATFNCEHFNEEKTAYMHAELKMYGQVLAISEQTEQTPSTGNTMMFCLHFGKGCADKVYQAFNVLKEGAQPHEPVANIEWSEHGFTLVDKYGVWWCVFE